MVSFTRTWHKLTKQLKRKRSLQSHESSKSVRFYDIDTVFYTHSSIEYDRTPTAESNEEDDTDDSDDDTLPSSPTNSIFTHSAFLTSTCFEEKALVLDDHSLSWENGSG
ncbi:hypothetical protein BC941DRAFT_409385 [Chlamydoabsidia padenii]|nr:hypothetical protein BC941DRAFT_409385 [Chlamydoabsidia padenii]